MTKFMIALMVLMMLTPATFAQGNLQIPAPQIEIMQSNHASALAPQMKFVSARVEQNAVVDGINGLKLHINFVIQDANCPCQINAWFYNDADGTRLNGSYPAYTDVGGKVAIWKDFTPNVNPAPYNDFTLWIPMRALNLQMKSGAVFNLRFKLGVYDTGKKRSIGNSIFYPFTLKFN